MHRRRRHHRIRHRFRLVRWAGCVDGTIMERSHDLCSFLARYLEPPALLEPAAEAFRARAAEGHRARGMEPFGRWPRSTLRSYDPGPADQRRALRDSEELRKEQGVIRIPEIPYDESSGAEPSRQSLDVFRREGLANAPAELYRRLVGPRGRAASTVQARGARAGGLPVRLDELPLSAEGETLGHGAGCGYGSGTPAHAGREVRRRRLVSLPEGALGRSAPGLRRRHLRAVPVRCRGGAGQSSPKFPLGTNS